MSPRGNVSRRLMAPSPKVDMAMSAKASDDAWRSLIAQLAVCSPPRRSSAGVSRAVLPRIDTANASLNAIVTVDPDAARRRQWSDAARARDELGPHGLPITAKDSYETAGMRTTCGRRDLPTIPTQGRRGGRPVAPGRRDHHGKTNMPTGNQDVQASNWSSAAPTTHGTPRARPAVRPVAGRGRHRGPGLTSFDYGLGDRRPHQDPGLITAVCTAGPNRPGARFLCRAHSCVPAR